MTPDDLVGPMEIAAMLGLKLRTVHQYKSRGLMPPAATVISGTTLWRRTDIVEWDRDRVTKPGGRHG